MASNTKGEMVKGAMKISERASSNSRNSGSVSDDLLWKLVHLWEEDSMNEEGDLNKGLSIGLQVAASTLRSYLPAQSTRSGRKTTHHQAVS